MQKPDALLVLYVTFKTVLALDAFIFLIWNYWSREKKMGERISPAVFVLGPGGAAPISLERIIREEAGSRKSGGQRARKLLICSSSLEHPVIFFACVSVVMKIKWETSEQGLSTPFCTQLLTKLPFIHACLCEGNNLTTYQEHDLTASSSPASLRFHPWKSNSNNSTNLTGFLWKLNDVM